MGEFHEIHGRCGRVIWSGIRPESHRTSAPRERCEWQETAAPPAVVALRLNALLLLLHSKLTHVARRRFVHQPFSSHAVIEPPRAKSKGERVSHACQGLKSPLARSRIRVSLPSITAKSRRIRDLRSGCLRQRAQQKSCRFFQNPRDHLDRLPGIHDAFLLSTIPTSSLVCRFPFAF